MWRMGKIVLSLYPGNERMCVSVLHARLVQLQEDGGGTEKSLADVTKLRSWLYGWTEAQRNCAAKRRIE